MLGCQIPEDTPVAQNQLTSQKQDQEKSPKYWRFSKDSQFPQRSSRMEQQQPGRWVNESCWEWGSGYLTQTSCLYTETPGLCWQHASKRSSSCVTGGNNYHSLVESGDQVKIRVPFQESTPHWLGGESPWGCVCVQVNIHVNADFTTPF